MGCQAFNDACWMTAHWIDTNLLHLSGLVSRILVRYILPWSHIIGGAAKLKTRHTILISMRHHPSCLFKN